MDVIRGSAGFREACDRARARGRSVGLVPTMGSFHEGHLSLIRRARADRDTVAVTIFVNPLQFGPNEDFAAYPRDLDWDLKLAEEEGADLVFVPEVDEMYPGGRPEVTVDPGPLGGRFEGAVRPGHFRGVLTVVAKLLNLAGPGAAYFGEKDAQQLALIRRMVRHLSFSVEIVGCPTVREPDGLALSSRNAYLAPEERAAASCLPRALRAATAVVGEGGRDAAAVAAAIREVVQAEPLAVLDYAVVVDEDTFEEVQRIARPARALLAARIGVPRLIDNAPLMP